MSERSGTVEVADRRAAGRHAPATAEHVEPADPTGDGWAARLGARLRFGVSRAGLTDPRAVVQGWAGAIATAGMTAVAVALALAVPQVLGG